MSETAVIAIDKEVHRKIKATAHERGQTIRGFVEVMFRDWCAGRQNPRTLVDSLQEYKTER